MGFLAPLFLLAAAAIAVPLLLHLFHRHEGQRVSFPALRYLLRTEQEHAKRIRLRQLVLLFMRLAIVVLLVLAGARLFVRGPGSGHDPTAVALILDNSMSAGVVSGEARVLDQLERLALETVAQGTPDDRFWVIRAGEPWDAAPSGGAAEAAERIRATEVSSASGDLSAAIVRARELLLASDLRAREIHLLSDLQATAFPTAAAQKPAGDLPVVVYRAEAEPPQNRYLHEVTVGGGLPPLAGQRTEISVTMAATDLEQRQEVPLRLLIDERIRGASATVPGRGVTLPIGPFPEGLVQGYVETDPDALSADDRRAFAFHVRPPPVVATAGGQAFFLDQALSVLEEGGRLQRGDPARANVLFSLGGEGLAPSRQGQAMVVLPPSDPTLLPALNRALAGVGIPWRVERPASPGEAEPSDNRLPLDLTDVRVRSHYALVPAGAAIAEEDVRVRLSNGEVWIASGSSSSGSYLLLGSPLDADATTLPVSAAMVPLLEWVMSLGSTSGAQIRRLEAGNPLTLSPLATHVRTPDGTVRVVDQTSMLRETRDAGPYIVLANDSVLEVVAVGPPLRESLLRRVDEESLDERIGDEVRVAEDAATWSRRIFVNRQGPELWKVFLTAALILLVAESWVAAPGGAGQVARVPRRTERLKRIERPVPESRNTVLAAVASCAAFDSVVSRLPATSGTITVGGLHGSAGAALLAALHEKLPKRVFVAVAGSVGAAEAIEADLEALLGSEVAWLYPQREALPYESDEPHLEIGGLRVEAVEALFSGRGRLLVATLKALQERSPVPEHLAGLRLTLSVGEALGLHDLVSTLEGRGFERVALVEEVGQLAVRGGIVDLFSFGSPEPVRVEFWGDEITSLRTFDILDQRSTAQLTQVHVLPVDFRRGPEGGSVPRSLLQLLPDGAVLVHVEPGPTHAHADPGEPWEVSAERTWRHVLDVRSEMIANGGQAPPAEELFMPPLELTEALGRFPKLVLGSGPGGDVVLQCEAPPAVDRNIPRLQGLLREGAAQGEETVILCDNEGQLQRLEELLDAAGGLPPGTRVGLGSVEGGFQLRCAYPPLRVFTDHEIFRRSRRLRRGRRFRGAVALESLAQLTPGDYVVHLDHGVGRFRGLERVTVGGEELEALAIEYAGEEILRVPVYRLDLVERWVGDTEDAEPPEVHRIGGKKWKTLRRRTEAAIEEMTAELIQLYARRAAAPGFAFSPDTRWQKEMESSFLYEDTPDQRKAAEDVKRDMESARPMDRLICGDVGYGKTEVALRAAFKAVQDGKQVAVLAPTTILVEQHRHTFDERLADYPVRIAALSRFRSAAETKEILDKLATGHVDILIGTHRLLSDDVDFKDLGLMIVDEEQRFGVKAKEKLKSLKTSVDVLTLTATPIPRTLYLSLTRIRDLSLIRTPPRDRMPIVTHVLPWSDHLLTDAVHRELDRGGQAFLLHNRVETIHAASERLRRLVPEARFEVAHGQMDPGDLDRIMTAFVDGEVDVLVCSSIIENGLDVPNANTLIVDRADRFGLSQLYQIRGRVGRSDRRAYCYLIVPPNLAEEAERRLRVLEHYTELGSGYSVALRDLELRGAGNLLGAEQSGFANLVGIDAYLRLVENTVTRLKQGGESIEHSDPEVSMGGAAYLPEGYVSDGGQKLHLYRRLSKIKHQPEVEDLRRELADRFGEPPPEVERLLDQVTLRILGRQLGVERILIREKSARVNFRPEVVPRLAVLERPLRDRQVVVQVRRMAPLSLELQRIGPEPLAPTLIRALTALGDKVQAA